MFNFYVVFAGHDMVTDAGRATTRRCKLKAPSLRKKVQKLMDLPKTWILAEKIEDFRWKKNTSSLDQTTLWNKRPRKTAIEFGPSKQ